MPSSVVAVQRAWRARSSRRLAHASKILREMCECVVCHDECVNVARCHNGHACCMGCALASSDNRCPVCRDPRPPVHETALPTALEACCTMMRCHSCGATTRPEECEHHRAWCPAHRFVCPWADCTQCVSASRMAEHVRHHGQMGLVRKMDQLYHAMILLTRLGESFVVCVRDTTVVVSSASHRRSFHESASSVMHVTLRAYYPDPTAPSIHATLRQVAVAGCDDRDSWSEEYRYGIVPPMIASRESVVFAWPSPIITPRTYTVQGEVGSVVIPDACPGVTKTLRDTVRQTGVRDLPRKLVPGEVGGAPTVLLHLMFREDFRSPISRVFDD